MPLPPGSTVPLLRDSIAPQVPPPAIMSPSLPIDLSLVLPGSGTIPIDPAILESIVVTPSIVLTEAEESILAVSERTRNQMANRYNKRFVLETFATDTVVTIRVRKGDRGTLDHPRLHARVVARPHPGRYQLQTEHGILDRLYLTGVLNRVPNSELVGMSLLTRYILNPIHLFIPLLVSALDLSSNTSVIMLHRAAALTSQATEIFLYYTCSHISTCQTRR